MDELIIAARAIHFVAVALVFGAPLFRLAVVPKHPGAIGGRALEVAAALAAFVSGLGWFAGVAATMAGSWSDALAPDVLWAVTFETRFGQLWIARLVMLAALVTVQAFGKTPSRLRDGALLLLAAGLAASLVGVGHGMAGAGHGPAVARVHMAADIVHLLCAMTWIGALFQLGRLFARIVAGREPVDLARPVLRRFSQIGYWAVTLVLITGCINALVMVPGPASLVGSDYGQALMVKLVLVLGMVVIALVNRVILTPPITAGADSAEVRNLWRSVVVEQGVGVSVLTAVAWLGTIHPVP